MSQNRTLLLAIGLITLLISSSSFSADDKPLTPFRQCVESRMGNLASMQNRWNPRTFVGGIHIDIVKICLQLHGSFEQKSKDKKSEDSRVLPASTYEDMTSDNEDTSVSI